MAASDTAGKAGSAGTSRRVPVLDDIENTDLNDERKEFYFRTPFLVSALAPFLKDERDLPMVCLQLNIIQWMVPSVLLVYYVNLWGPSSLLLRNILGLAHMVAYILLFQGRFVLMLHFSSHRPIWKPQADLLNYLPNTFMAPFFGIPPGVYKLHHVIMHHIENNHGRDASSTECYQRDSPLHFLMYCATFVARIWWDLPFYTVQSKMYDSSQTLGLHLTLYVVGVYLLYTYVSPLATLWVFIIPYFFAMSVMALGNWGQHVFINPEDKDSNYCLTFNCINAPENKSTFNDGYHILHHANARLHWMDLPKTFVEQREKHYKMGAITFQHVHFLDVSVLVLTGQLRKLAEKYYVHIGPREEAPTVDEVEAKLRKWLQPITAVASTTAATKAE